jgi:hypothetical protein
LIERELEDGRSGSDKATREVSLEGEGRIEKGMKEEKPFKW